jgi:hypothetical protein
MIIEYPELLLVVALVGLGAASALGTWANRRYPVADDFFQDFRVVLGAALTLLGLIVGFSFSMAAGRYEQRRDLEGAEANAIGTEYQRAALLPAPEAAVVKRLLRTYTDLRIQFYAAHDDDALKDINVRTGALQGELWSAIVPVATDTPTPITALVVSGMNEAFNARSSTQAAWLNRVPVEAWWLLAVMSVGCIFFLGYGFRSTSATRRLSLVMPLLVSVALALIADIDSPRRGMIRIPPQNLLDLVGTMAAP